MKKKLLLILFIILFIGTIGAVWYIRSSMEDTSTMATATITESPVENTTHEPSGEITIIPTEPPTDNTESSNWWISINTPDLKYDTETQAYYIDQKLNLSCELNPEKRTTFISCTVTNEFGDTVFYCEPAPSDMVTINSIGLFWGYNEVKFICENTDAEYETTYAFYNSSPENVAGCNIDQSDNDGDTISNYLESLWGTNIDLADTDEDGMDDYQELYVLHTDPLSADFNSNGISDFEEDADLDEIKSMDEILIYQTNPFSSDTDNDGISDNDELFTYNTNPLLADTDGDGLHDGNEVHHKYDPLTANTTFEITKAETSGGVTAQASINVNGTDAQSFTVNVSEDVRFNDNTPGYLSDAFSFDIDSSNPGTVTLSFTLQEGWLHNEDILPAICCFDEETQCFYALDTSIANGIATAQTTHFSTYMLLNLKTMYKPQGAVPNLTDFEYLPPAGVDSNNDGITDLDTYLLCNGFILTGTGQKAFGDATYEEIQANSDFDGDGLLNGEEVKLKYLDTVPQDATEYNGHFYKTYDIGEYWDTARFKAENMGGYLCTITSLEEQEFVKNLLPDDGMGLYWMGSSLTENGWAWVTGEPFEYTHWGDSEPNNLNAVEAYVEMYAKPFKKKIKGDWNDASNEGAQYSDNFYVIENTGYIVEWDDNNLNMKYAVIHSNPITADTDSDGISDANDTAIFVRGLKDGIIAKLTLISSNNEKITKGHAFLILHSYVNDLELDVSQFYQGMDVLSEIVYIPNSSPTTYTLESGTDITLGAAGNSSIYDFGQTDSFYLSTYGEWENAGLWYNLEAYKYHIKYARYSPNSCVDYELKQIDFLTLESELYNTGYHGLINNCSSVAENVWNAVVSDDRKVDAALLPFIETPYSLKDNIEASFADYYSYDLSSLRLALKK